MTVSGGAVSRRTVLGAAALGLLGVAGCAGSPPVAGPPAPTTTPPAPAPTPPAPGPPDWAALRARLTGTLVLPGEPGYDTSRRAYSTLFDARRPAAVASCASPADVQACLEVARGSALPVAARSGGHSYAGYCVPDGGLVIDLGPMASAQVAADGTATIGSGARLGEVYTAVAGAGRALPAGSCSTVGIGGLTLGGGIGVLARAFGLTCDRLLSAQVVTPDSTLRTASAQDEPDLLWALRGGGGGNAGVVTSFTFSTEPAPTVTVFSLRFAAGAATDVVGAWQGWIAAAPDELWSNCVASGGPMPAARVGGAFVGDERGCRDQLARLLASSPQPTSTMVSTRDYLSAMRWFAGSSKRAAFVASSRVLPTPLADPSALVALLARPGVDVLLDALGGAVARTDPATSAFAHRSAFASAQIYASVVGGDARPETAAVAEIRDGLGAITGPTGYVNYIDPGMPDWARAYYGEGLPRLRRVVNRYDPEHVLSFAQGLA